MPIEQTLLLILAAAIGSSYGIIFGGGSFMVLPVLFILGVDAKIAIATNVVAAILQPITGTIMFSKLKKVDYGVVKRTAPFYLIGAVLGVLLLLRIEGDLIRILVSVAIIFFALYGLFRREAMLSGSCTPAKMSSPTGILSLLFGGAYQVTVTAGAGTLLTYILIYIYGLTLKCAIYTRQVVNLPAFIVASGMFIYVGLVDWRLFFPLALGRFIGSYIGSKLVLKSHSKPLSILFSVVVIALALRTLFF